MKLIASHTSPYARKVRVVLAEKRIAHALMEENVWKPDTQVTRYNPITKVPTLVLDDGNTLYDSSVITEYLEGLGAPALIPGTGVARALVRRDESLGDAICDAAVGLVLERKREALRQDPASMARQMGKIESGFAAAAASLGDKPFLHGELSVADIAIGCALFYVSFRLPEVAWKEKHPNLAAYASRLDARPSFAATRPPAGA